MNLLLHFSISINRKHSVNPASFLYEFYSVSTVQTVTRNSSPCLIHFFRIFFAVLKSIISASVTDDASTLTV